MTGSKLHYCHACKTSRVALLHPFFFRKKEYEYINFVPKLVRRPSVCPSVTFHVNASPIKPLSVAT